MGVENPRGCSIFEVEFSTPSDAAENIRHILTAVDMTQSTWLRGLRCLGASALLLGHRTVAEERRVPPDVIVRKRKPHLRVLITGFNDWRDLGEPLNIWRCRSAWSSHASQWASRRYSTHQTYAITIV